ILPHEYLARLYQTEFIRSARAVGMLWAICTLCFAIIEVVILIQPSWVGTRELHYRGGGPAPPTGTLGLFEVCMEMDWPVPECRGSLRTLTPLSAFQSPAVLVCMSLTMVWASVGCLCLFRFCNAATVYKICAWLQLTAGETLQLIPQVSSAHHEKFLFIINTENFLIKVICYNINVFYVTFEMNAFNSLKQPH
uniref:LHFPL tetraspan subfamily member 4b n=1 Tax=Cyprinus carpio TaxID=7962 RepID=A0A8C1VZ60_CYPCA